MTIIAKYAGRSTSGEPIVPGDVIARDGRGWKLIEPGPDNEAHGWWGSGEYPLADQVYDARGGAASDYEWYGGGD